MPRVRLYKERNGYWYVDIHNRGRRTRGSLGTRVKEVALAAARRVERDLAEGRKPFGHFTLAPFLDTYLQYCEGRNAPRTVKEKRRFKKLFLGILGDVPIESISRSDIDRYVKTRNAGAATTNRELAMLKHALNFALDRELIIRNPAARVKMLSEGKREIRILTTQELYTWFTWCRKNDLRLYNLSAIALNTGLRPGDILKIRGEDVNLEMGLIEVVMSKTGKTNYIPLNDITAAVFRRLPRKGYVFPGRERHLSYSPFYGSFLKAKNATGIAFRFYDFRHNAAIRLLEAGADVVTIKEILGHTDIKTTVDSYLKIVDKRKRAALQRLAAKSGGMKAEIPGDLSPSDFELD